MSIETRYDQTTDIRYHVASGTITVDDIAKELASVYGSDDLPTHCNVIWDLTDADVTGILSSEVSQLAQFVKSAWQDQGDYKVGFAVKPGVTHGLARMYEQLLGMFDKGHIRIFRSYDEAHTWITS